MTAARPDGSPLARVRQALESQQQALVSGDAMALDAAGTILAQALNDLRGNGLGSLAAGSRQELASAAGLLNLNAQMLQRMSASNQRALNVLFEPSATYGLSGANGLASPSRALRAV